MDDTFTSLSPREQEKVVSEIIATTGSNRPPSDAAQHSLPPQPAPEASSMIATTNSPPANPDTSSPSGTRHFSDEWVQRQEADYQRSLQDAQEAIADPANKPEQTTTLGAAGLGALDGATFGFDDELGSGLAAVIPGIGKRSIWDGSSLSDAYASNVKAYRGEKDAAWNEHPWAYGAGSIVGGLVPISRAGKAAMLAKDLTLGQRVKTAATVGAKAGAAYGAGSDTGGIADRLDGAASGAALGAIGGAAFQGAASGAAKAANPVLEKLMPKLAQDRFARLQADNPHSLTDAQVSDDLSKMVQTMLSAKAKQNLKPNKDQERVLLSRVDDLERSYLPSDELKALDLAPSVKARLQTAMAKRHLLSEAEVSALRDGTPAGDAVAEGIAKARRLRAYVAEVSGSDKGAGRLLSEAFGSAAGWKLGGPMGGAAGSVAGRLLTPSGSRQAARAALDLAAQAPKFAQLPEVAAARETQAVTDSLSRVAAEALDAPYLAKQAADAEAERLAQEGRKVSIANARDDVKPSGGWRGLIYARTGLPPSQQDAGALAALKDGHISPEQFQAFLDAPDKLMVRNAGNALVDRLDDMATKGKLKRDPEWKPREPEWPTSTSPMLDAQGQPIRSLPAYQAGAAKNIARDLPLLQELDAINVDRAARYDSDPEYAKIAGTDADPYMGRIKAIQDILAANRKGKANGGEAGK